MSAQALLDALDAAQDDAQRRALFEAAPRTTRQALSALLTYRKVMDVGPTIEAAQTAFDAFSLDLDGAANDDERARLIEGAARDPPRGHEWLAEWSWRRTATVEHWQRRYLQSACHGDIGDAT